MVWDPNGLDPKKSRAKKVHTLDLAESCGVIPAGVRELWRVATVLEGISLCTQRRFVGMLVERRSAARLR